MVSTGSALPPIIAVLQADATPFFKELGKVNGAVSDMAGNTEKEVKKANSKFSDMGDGAGERFGGGLMTGIKRFAVPLAGVIAGFGIGAAISSTVGKFEELAGGVKGLGRITGGTTEEVSGLRGALKLAGVDSGVADTMIGRFSRTLGAASLDTEKAARMTERLGINFQDATGNVRPMVDLLPELADKFQTMPAGAEKTALAMQLFGRNGVAMLPFLNKGSEGIAELSAKAEGMGLTLDDVAMNSFSAAKLAAREFGSQVEGLQVTIGGSLLPIIDAFKTSMYNTVAPVLGKITQALANNSEFFFKVADAIQKFGATVGEMLTPTITAVLEKFQSMGTSLQPLILSFLDIASASSPMMVIFQVLKDILPPLIPPIMELAQALGGVLVVAGGAIIDLFKALQPAIKILGDVLANTVVPAITEFVKIFGGVLGEVLKTIMPIIGSLATTIATVLAGALKDILPVILDLVKMLGPILTDILKVLAPILEDLGKIFGKIFGQQMKIITEIITDLVKVLGPILGDVLKMLAPIIGKLGEAFMKIVEAVFPLVPVVLKLVQAFIPLIEPLLKLVMSILGPLLDLISPLIDLFVALARPLMDLLVPVIQILGDILLWLVENIIKPVLEVAIVVLGGVFEWLGGVIGAIIDFIVGAINFFADTAQAQFKQAGETFQWIYDNIFKPVGDFIALGMQALGAVFTWLYENIIKPVMEGIGMAFDWVWKNVIKPVVDFINGAIKTVGDTVKNVFGGIGDFLEGVFAGIGSFFKGIINGMIDALNWAQDIINPIIDGPLGDAARGIGLNITHLNRIPHLAEGGIVMPRPGGQMVIAGEAGEAEAIVPLSKMGQMGGNNITVNVQSNASPVRIANEIGWQLRLMG